MKNFDLESVDCHVALGMIEKRWGFPRRTLRALFGMTKNAQSGRSMIEMLGVLAIIGVLSVGGIAGYSKAMMKYRINKTIEFVTHCSQNIRTFFSSQKNYKDLDSLTNSTILKKANLVPHEMWGTYVDSEAPENNFETIFGAFGESIEISHKTNDNDYTNNAKAFWISLGADPDTALSAEACIELASQDWSSVSSGFIGLSIGIPSDASHDILNCLDSSKSSGGDVYLTACVKDTSFPLALDKVVKSCSDVYNANYNSVSFNLFYK